MEQRRRDRRRLRWLALAGRLISWPLLVLSFQLCYNSPNECDASQLADFDGATFYKAPLGSRVRIACNGSHWSDESVSLVLWFKGTIERHSVPIYTVDARQRPLNGGARHLVADAYKSRARFVTKATPPYLDLAPLEEEDQSEYRCRIDYRSRPRENFLVILFVLVPPKSVQIMDSGGRSLEQIYGPLSEGSNLTLLCISKGGRPAPAITWRRGSKLIDDSYLTLNDFLALKQSGQLLAASGGESPNGSGSSDNNQQQQRRMNSINADPSLEAVWREWRQWPEYDYYAHHYAALSSLMAASANSSSSNVHLFAGQQPASRKLAGAASGAGSGATGQQQQQQQNLLTMSVHESIATSVNVLQVAQLERWNQEQGSSKAALESQLECQASNLHYDLRALIKLFAPPSLLPGLNSSGPSEQQAGAAEFAPLPEGPGSGGAQVTGGQLGQFVWAAGRALEWSLRAGEWPSSASLPGELAAGHQVEAHSAAIHSTAALRQMHQPEQWASNSSEINGHLGAAGIIQQQLARPHQLAQLAGRQQQLSTAAGSDVLVRSKLIALDVYLRPLDVRITGLQRPLSAGQVFEFTCTSSGARPPAKLTWLKNGRPLEAKLARQLDEPTANGSHSRLALPVEQADNGAQLVCRAENERLAQLLAKGTSEDGQRPQEGSSIQTQTSQAARLEDSTTLTVHYSPKLKLELGNKMLSNAIREGTDIYFVCHVEAMPSIKELTWLHNGRPVNETFSSSSTSSSAFLASSSSAGFHSDQSSGGTPKEGLIISNNSLVLQRVRVEQRGHYACMASNSEGISESNRIELRVLHAPICVASDSSGAGALTGNMNGAKFNQRHYDATNGQQHATSASNTNDNNNNNNNINIINNKHELLVFAKPLRLRSQIRLLCRMESDPASDVEFTWYLNNSHSERRLLFTGNASTIQEGGGGAPTAPVKRQELVDWQANNSNTLEQPPAAQWSEQTGNSPGARLEATESGGGRRKITSEATSTSATQTASSQLNYLLDTSLDYGRIYCVARNSMGQQKRACVYELQQPDPHDALAHELACVAVNVTTSSAWIVCEPPGSHQATSSYTFTLELHSATGEPDERLEAVLSTPVLREPVFSVSQLRPSTSYTLLMRPQASPNGGGLQNSPAESLVHFSTGAGPAAEHQRRPLVEPIAEAAGPGGLSALISTRSTNGHLAPTNELHPSAAAANSGRLYQQHPERPAEPAAAGGLASQAGRLWTALASALNLPGSGRQAGGSARPLAAGSGGRRRPEPDSALVDASSLPLVASLGLLLLAALTFTLLLYRRGSALLLWSRSEKSKRDRRRENNNKMRRRAEKFELIRGRRAGKGHLGPGGARSLADTDEPEQEAPPPVPSSPPGARLDSAPGGLESTAPEVDANQCARGGGQRLPSTAHYHYYEGQRQAAGQLLPGYLATARQQHTRRGSACELLPGESGATAAGGGQLQVQLHLNSGSLLRNAVASADCAANNNGRQIRVSKSRSSVCLPSIGASAYGGVEQHQQHQLPAPSGLAHCPQQQQPRLIHFGYAKQPRLLISDANSLASALPASEPEAGTGTESGRTSDRGWARAQESQQQQQYNAGQQFQLGHHHALYDTGTATSASEAAMMCVAGTTVDTTNGYRRADYNRAYAQGDNHDDDHHHDGHHDCELNLKNLSINQSPDLSQAVAANNFEGAINQCHQSRRLHFSSSPAGQESNEKAPNLKHNHNGSLRASADSTLERNVTLCAKMNQNYTLTQGANSSLLGLKQHTIRPGSGGGELFLFQPPNHHQRTLFSTDVRPSSSLISDESSDSTQAHCTWSLTNNNNKQQHLCTNQMQFIELLPGNANGFDMSLIGNVLTPDGGCAGLSYGHEPDLESFYLKNAPATAIGPQQQRPVGQQLVADNHRHYVSTMLASPPDGSLEQADPSPLSNTTLSQTDSLRLNNDLHEERAQDSCESGTSRINGQQESINSKHNHHRAQISTSNTPLVSILKNSSSINHVYGEQEQQQQDAVCQCNGNEAIIDFVLPKETS